MKISMSELLEAPRSDVFNVFTDIENASERISGIRKLEVLSEVRRGVGLRWRESRVMFGKEATDEMEITGFDEPDSYVVEAESLGTHYVSRFRFQEVEPGKTQVVWEFEGRAKTLAAKLMAPLGRPWGCCSRLRPRKR